MKRWLPAALAAGALAAGGVVAAVPASTPATAALHEVRSARGALTVGLPADWNDVITLRVSEPPSEGIVADDAAGHERAFVLASRRAITEATGGTSDVLGFRRTLGVVIGFEGTPLIDDGCQRTRKRPLQEGGWYGVGVVYACSGPLGGEGRAIVVDARRSVVVTVVLHDRSPDAVQALLDAVVASLSVDVDAVPLAVQDGGGVAAD